MNVIAILISVLLCIFYADKALREGIKIAKISYDETFSSKDKIWNDFIPRNYLIFLYVRRNTYVYN